MIDLFNRGQRLRQPGTEALDFIFMDEGLFIS